jgi:hypothetical protein
MKKVLAQVKPNHSSKFVWAQFHGLENYYQGTNNVGGYCHDLY